MRGTLEKIIDLLPGLWLWRTRHPHWTDDADWDPVVTSVCARRGRDCPDRSDCSGSIGGRILEKNGRRTANADYRIEAGSCT